MLSVYVGIQYTNSIWGFQAGRERPWRNTRRR